MEKTATYIAEQLRDNGFLVYFAGGFVRDQLLGKICKDIDIVTSATPEEIEKIFHRTYPVGKKFGVMLVHEKDLLFEVATFRSDSGYSDGRRPEYIVFADPKEDALRRDFTINGLFYDPFSKNIIDYVGGIKDVEEGVIRFIGNPEERIQEDYLRILRAVRFAHQIRGQYEPKTYEAIKKYAYLVEKISAERVQSELTKMLMLPTRAQCCEDLQDLGILRYVLPEVERLKGVAQPRKYHKEGSVWNHAMRSIASLRGKDATDKSLLWATLLHDIGKPDTFHVEERIRFDRHAELSKKYAQNILQRLHFPKNEIEKICWVIEHHMSLDPILLPDTSFSRKVFWVTHPWFPLLLKLHRADARGSVPVGEGMYRLLRQEMKKILLHVPKKIKKLISGDEVARILGIAHGPELGRIMKHIHEWQKTEKHLTKQNVIDKLKDFPYNN